MQRLGVPPESPDWHRHGEFGWIYGTSADVIRAERDTPSLAELAQTLPKANGRALLQDALERRREMLEGENKPP